MRDSVISGNVGNGIRAATSAGKGPAFALVERSSIVNNRLTGILAEGPGATILLKESTITRNGTGVSTSNSGQLISYGNNTNNNNIGAEGVPTGFFSLM
jgi:parallel beta helix pectate lyase-like protein